MGREGEGRPTGRHAMARWTARCGLLLVPALCAVLLLLPARGAGADPAELCAGYAACSLPGFTTHGYPRAAAESWWSMYGGINCTNYAAFVESQVYGVPVPALLLGDAYQWSGRAAQAGIPVDQTPTVGAVAVWGEGAPGMGSDGHVAVVEAIGPGGSYIDVSQSGMGTANDGYDWERVYREGGSWESWPSSFIHFAGSGTPAVPPAAGSRLPGAELVSAGG
ncbi:MAG TPA: CHAP domain-containing protein [Solirubrobacteraceae bacterium]|nr:CHAP domain-containing protein [Solirubrobacteraceae bacterium]